MDRALHEDVREVHEHGQAWFVCSPCGAIWDAQDEEISEGDGSCEDAIGSGR